MIKRKVDVADMADPSKKQKSNTDVIKYYLMPSLQHMSISNIIISIWNQSVIKYQIVKLFDECEGSIMNKFLKIEDKVLDKLSQLDVPNRMRQSLSNIVHPIGNEIFRWIKYHDKYIFNNNGYSIQPIAVNFIDDLVWTPRGVIDYKETAKTLLAKEEKLLDAYKYNIACTYCFEDNVAIIAPRVINTTLKLHFFQRQTMIYFWTAHITGDFTELDNAVHSYNNFHNTNYSTNECLFTVLIGNGTNQVVIKYIWDKLSNEEKSRQIVPAIIKTSDIDIRCFLLSQISKEQEKEVFKICDASLVLDFLDHWLWGDYFLPTIHHIWDIMSGWVYLNVLENIVNKMENNHEDIEKCNQYKDIFKELWQCAPKHLKEYVFDPENSYHSQGIFLKLFCKKNIDMIRLILTDIDDVQKKQIMFSNYGIEGCSICITSNQWDLLEMFTGHTLYSGEHVEFFKKALIKGKGRKIAEHFILNKEWNKVDQFLQWAFKSDDDIREYKQELSNSMISNDILKSIVANNKADFTELEQFFKWCTSGDEERVVKLKALVPKFNFKKICKLIEEDKYEFLEQILHWCFASDKKQIAQFKQNCFPKCIEMAELIVNLIKQDDQFQSFEKFVHWCFINEEEISKFKTCILHPPEGRETLGVCLELLCKDMFKLADKFVSWCYNSSQIQIDIFKNQLIINDVVECLFSDRMDSQAFSEVIRWFNPSIETIIGFKEKFINSWWFKFVLPAVDSYVQQKLSNQDKAERCH